MILGKYNQAKTITFDLVAPDGVDLVVAATFAAGDVVIMKDEGAEASTTNLPTDEGTGYSLVLTATEMSAARIRVYIIDQTATKVWLDVSLGLETYGNASAEHAFDLDTANVTLAAATHTGAVIPTVSAVSSAVTLPTIPTNWISAAGIAASAMDGKGNWNIGKTGYALTQAFPANFSDMAITITTGRITVGTNNDKSGYSISGTKTTLDALNDIAATAIVSGGAINTTTGAVDVVTIASNMRGTDGANTATPPTAAAITDAVWDELQSGHVTAGTFGKFLDVEVSSVSGGGGLTSQNVRDAMKLAPTAGAPATGSVDLHLDAIEVDTNDLQTNQSAWATATGFATEVKQDAQDLIITESRLSELDAANLPNTTDLILTDTGTTIPAQITALNDPTAAAIAAAVSAYDMGNGRTIKEALSFLRNKWTLIGATLTVYDTDDTTVLWTSAIAKTAGDPVSSSDPV